MGEVASYAPGVPAWVDLSTSDPAGAREFYRSLFGWVLDIGPDETGNYTMCLLGEAPVAGMNGQPGPEGMAPGWITYLATEDADASARQVTEHGGHLKMGPADAGTAGRVVVATDPAGALFGLWQAGEHIGAVRVNEPGAVIWNDLVTDDLDRAQTFLSAVCDYAWAEEDTGGQGPPRRTFMVGGRPVGRVMRQPTPDVPPHWLPYFAVADPDAAVATAERHGAPCSWRRRPRPTARSRSSRTRRAACSRSSQTSPQP